MNRVTGLLLALLAVAAIAAPTASAAEEWHSEQPIAAGIGLPEPLGEVGDIEFWAPNRGALIAAGVGGIPAGVYVYDGVGWHLYSTVCGGHQGRIAWTGPDEFWTVSDQPAGQEANNASGEGQVERTWNRSLCHFQNGRVVASYAEPLGGLGSYQRINAVACAGPADCWFGGERLPGTVNHGAFHLLWDGASMTSFPALTEPQAGIEDPPRAVADMAFAEGRLYESVQVAEGDGEVPGEPDPAQPSFIHLVEPGSARPFRPLFTSDPLSYGGELGDELGGFRFADAGEGLFAIAGSSGHGSATVTMVAVEGESVRQVPLGPNVAFQPGDRVTGVAAEPGGGRIWVAYRHAIEEAPEPNPTRVVAVWPDGRVEAPQSLITIGGARKGSAGPVSCSAYEQCWLATERGWLYHLGGPLPRDEDPALVGPITVRPSDDSTPPLPPVELPEDDSGVQAQQRALPPLEIAPEPLPHRPRPKPLISKVKQKVIGGRVLQLSFRLFSPASVRLIARRGKKVVASTAKLTLASGPHKLRLRLDPKRWPNHLDFEVHPAAKVKK
jgi:hypothetical protein